ncbi:MAG: hypothetical protein IPI65_14460 [Bacteroidetes bacterium]|nr:hypothetical protein [Bacteroidota bacterium]
MHLNIYTFHLPMNMVIQFDKQFDRYHYSTVFTSKFNSPSMTYNFTTKVALKFYVQYDDLNDQLSSNLSSGITYQKELIYLSYLIREQILTSHDLDPSFTGNR